MVYYSPAMEFPRQLTYCRMADYGLRQQPEFELYLPSLILKLFSFMRTMCSLHPMIYHESDRP